MDMNSSIIPLVIFLLVCANASADQKSTSSNIRAKRSAGRGFEDGASDASKARQLLHDSDYVSVSGQFYEFKGYAAADLQLPVDGPKNNGTGIPYFYIHKNDPKATGVKHDNRNAVFLSEGLIGKGRCENLPFGLKDEDCPRAELYGKLKEVSRLSPKFREVHGWLQDKYVGFRNLGTLKDLEYELWVLDIEQILIGKDGAIAEVAIDDYLQATPAKWID